MGEEQKTQLQEIYDKIVAGKNLKITVKINTHCGHWNNSNAYNTVQTVTIIVKNRVATATHSGGWQGECDTITCSIAGVTYEEI